MGPAGLVPVDEQALRLPSSDGGRRGGRHVFRLGNLNASRDVGAGGCAGTQHLRVPELLWQVTVNTPETLKLKIMSHLCGRLCVC